MTSASLRGNLAANIRHFRRAKDLSQERLAEMCGLHRTYVGSVERGERNVTLSTVEAFAAALGVGAIDLLKPRNSRVARPAARVRGRRG
ncbi:MAG: helix-turn-helix transcriptional regulator [Myxococcales bacterium]|nr:helix-turn-helix transcriptional regulator [Myxococcales bacterium]MCB9521433.1 helix-turn-helix transcriptional regulator [Myxococcales bacterium]